MWPAVHAAFAQAAAKRIQWELAFYTAEKEKFSRKTNFGRSDRRQNFEPEIVMTVPPLFRSAVKESVFRYTRANTRPRRHR